MAPGEAPPTAGLRPRWRDLLAPSGGPTLEEAICKSVGLPDIEIVSTGTAALLVAFTYLKRRHPRRNTVIVPGYTCPLVVIAAAAAGLQAVACDTVAGGFDLDGAHLARLIGDDTLALVPTHYGGVLTDIGRLRRAAAAAGGGEVPIIEDAAQAFGATWGGASVGLAGDIGIFSFGAGKGFTLYEGGALVARDGDVMAGLRAVARELASASMVGELWRCALLAGYHALYNPVGLRLVYGAGKRAALARGDDIGAAGDRFPMSIAVGGVGSWRKRVGLAALARLEAHLARSRARFRQLAERLSAIPGVHAHRPVASAVPSATFLFATLPPGHRSAEVIRTLWRSRAGVAKLFARAIGDYPDLRPLLRRSETPNARALADTTLTLTTHDALSPTAEAFILDTIMGGLS
jgi:dTDP-4-amino-4,6-dideoxygalactose transaminase